MFLQCSLSFLLKRLTLANEWKDADGNRPQWYIPFYLDYRNDEGHLTVSFIKHEYCSYVVLDVLQKNCVTNRK